MKREIQGLWLPPSKVVVKLGPGAAMPPREEFATEYQRIKDTAGAYALAYSYHKQYAQGFPLIMTRRQAEELVKKFPQFEIFG